MRETLTITKALADENRLRILMMIQDQEVCVCQIVEMLDVAASTVSKHLSILRAADLIDSYKQGRWVYYHVPKQPTPTARAALAWVAASLADSSVIKNDRKKGFIICEQDPVELAKLQRQR